jgi:hypothetical protein
VLVDVAGVWITVDSIGIMYLLVAVSDIILFMQLQYERRASTCLSTGKMSIGAKLNRFPVLLKVDYRK